MERVARARRRFLPARTALSAVMHTFPFVSDSLSQRRRPRRLKPHSLPAPMKVLTQDSALRLQSPSIARHAGRVVGHPFLPGAALRALTVATSASPPLALSGRLSNDYFPTAVGHRDNDDRPGESFRSDDMFDDYYCTYESGCKSFDPLTPVDPSCPADSNVRRADHFALHFHHAANMNDFRFARRVLFWT